MNEKHFFADVELPFHVWMREGDRWVLRKAPHGAGDENDANKPAAATRMTRKSGAADRRAAG